MSMYIWYFLRRIGWVPDYWEMRQAYLAQQRQLERAEADTLVGDADDAAAADAGTNGTNTAADVAGGLAAGARVAGDADADTQGPEVGPEEGTAGRDFDLLTEQRLFGNDEVAAGVVPLAFLSSGSQGYQVGSPTSLGSHISRVSPVSKGSGKGDGKSGKPGKPSHWHPT